ncbi:MAG: 50S ribosomal protein L4 [Verrucomicrobia bacterium]|jgi:large subunit ribosomal protein L4|nr:50S ribosomal protein L4 [Verrucomicrobiota bacterium]
MASIKCKKYDLKGVEAGIVELSYDTEKEVNSQLVKDYIVALRENARQWSAKVKGRSENNHSGKKPHAQKGTGKARQGFLGAPQYRGGGRVHGPRPKFDQEVRMNRKSKRAVVQHLLAQKMEEGNVIFLQDDFETHLKAPKTKAMSALFSSLGFSDLRVACYGLPEQVAGWGNFIKSVRNIPRVSCNVIDNINGYDILVNGKIIVMASAKEQLEAVLKR